MKRREREMSSIGNHSNPVSLGKWQFQTLQQLARQHFVISRNQSQDSYSIKMTHFQITASLVLSFSGKQTFRINVIKKILKKKMGLKIF
jgi:hypothetical protein